jgi:hypothetical protein
VGIQQLDKIQSQSTLRSNTDGILQNWPEKLGTQRHGGASVISKETGAVQAGRNTHGLLQRFYQSLPSALLCGIILFSFHSR